MTCVQQVVLQVIIPVHKFEIILDMFIFAIDFPLSRANDLCIKYSLGSIVEIGV